MRPTQNCFYCGKPATLLCDFILALPLGGYENGHAVAKIAPMHTCDMPLCREHAEYRGWIHIKAAKRSQSGFDSYDYCLEHRGVSDNHGAGAPTVHEDEAATLRRAVRAAAQRRLMRERGLIASDAHPLPPEQLGLF
jgi:hypothetical protein